MINPDGVIYGNFRTNLAGYDLNRQWAEPNKVLHSEIFTVSRFLSTLNNIELILDFHGHSKLTGACIFACTGEPAYPFRVFPYLYSLI
jgi:hypothetical protein